MLSQTLQPPEIELVTIAAGEFIMGRLESFPRVGEHEEPAHPVMLEEYQIGRYPITNAQYLPFVQDTGHPAPDTWHNGAFPEHKANHPVSGVVWADAWLYCAWLRWKTGKPYHLPTEAEWEKAATWNPVTGRKQLYPWGDVAHKHLCNSLGAGGSGDTTPVGAYSPQGDSPYGCADMLGNVEEWCNSLIETYPYKADDGSEELHRMGRRAQRGGDWYYTGIPTAIRRNLPSDWWVHLWGFRVALGSSLDEAHQSYLRRVQAYIAKVEEKRQVELEENPTNAQNWYDRGTLRLSFSEMGQNRLAEAEQDFTQALQLVEQSSRSFFTRVQKTLESPLAWVYFNRASARFGQKNYEAAFTDINEAIKRDPKDPDAFILRAKIACRLQHWSQAKQDLTTLVGLKVKDNTKTSYFIEAEIAFGSGEYQRAIQLFSTILKRSKVVKSNTFTPIVNPEVYLLRGQAYEQLGQTQKAFSDYCHYLLWRPNAPEAPSLLARMS
jgi:formylglycine-generating enzyme required for sulfatase activity/tetratricopeptide (TPR) repeat protein